MSEHERLNNIWNFINHTTIVSGHGYEYKKAIQLLVQGYTYDSVLEWYNKEMGIEDENKSN